MKRIWLDNIDRCFTEYKKYIGKAAELFDMQEEETAKIQVNQKKIVEGIEPENGKLSLAGK